MDELELSILFDKYNEAFVSIKDRFDLLYKELSIYKDNNPIEYINYRDNEFPKLYKDVPSDVTVLTLPQFIGDKYQMFSPNRNNRKYGCWLSFKKKSWKHLTIKEFI